MCGVLSTERLVMREGRCQAYHIYSVGKSNQECKQFLRTRLPVPYVFHVLATYRLGKNTHI